ncbi:hypothetical protein LS70_006275 [Helicobacter sp. MIT 11-5569]|uniref:hypothetical protein n=1 Tax=Helicobacter sp. MIT 11-5569 TaxID=1548151 RepID=UPI000B3298A6|nr:hypothetical protein [Helicobacter sp. MIT 11-5569]TLD82894.1 hypothetical protein LS70_006275 [Helicobacter sp. MIT 11-5569]
MKAFALLEFLIFIIVISIVAIGILSNLKQNSIKELKNPNYFDLKNVTFCSKIAPNCILDSKIPPLVPLFEINATKAP